MRKNRRKRVMKVDAKECKKKCDQRDDFERKWEVRNLM